MVDLPKAFGCISGKLLIAQHRAYVFDTKLAVYYLHDRTQKVKIDECNHSISDILFGVSQWSILKLLLLTIFS